MCISPNDVGIGGGGDDDLQAGEIGRVGVLCPEDFNGAVRGENTQLLNYYDAHTHPLTILCAFSILTLC